MRIRSELGHSFGMKIIWFYAILHLLLGCTVMAQEDEFEEYDEGNIINFE